MASSYSTDLKLELMVTGENAGTWGDKTNTNLNLIQQAVAGYEAVTITDSATTALVMSQAALSNARNMVIKIATITLTGATTVTIPNGIEKFYIFDLTAVTGVTNLTIKTASGTGFTAGEAKIVAAYSDGTNLNEIALDTLGGTIGTAQIADNAITSAKISANQVTTAKIADNAITTAKISALQVTGAKIAQSTITAAKLATDSVGPDQLISTGVTAGSYTTANITVDADGRITAASSGAGGDGGFVYVEGSQGGYDSTAQTYTANPAATKIAVFAIGGGGGGGRGTFTNCSTARRAWGGGMGGFGVYYANIAAPYTQPFTAGAPGIGYTNPITSNGPGAAGGASSFGPSCAPLLLANGGAGGPEVPTPNGTGWNPSNVYYTYGTSPTNTKDLSLPYPGTGPEADMRRISAFTGEDAFIISYRPGPTAKRDDRKTGRGGFASAAPTASDNGGGGLVAIYELLS